MYELPRQNVGSGKVGVIFLYPVIKVGNPWFSTYTEQLGVVLSCLRVQGEGNSLFLITTSIFIGIGYIVLDTRVHVYNE